MRLDLLVLISHSPSLQLGDHRSEVTDEEKGLLQVGFLCDLGDISFQRSSCMYAAGPESWILQKLTEADGKKARDLDARVDMLLYTVQIR